MKTCLHNSSHSGDMQWKDYYTIQVSFDLCFEKMGTQFTSVWKYVMERWIHSKVGLALHYENMTTQINVGLEFMLSK